MISLVLSGDLGFEQDIRELLQAFFPGESFIHERDGASLLCVEADRTSMSLESAGGPKEGSEPRRESLVFRSSYELTGERRSDKSVIKRALYGMLRELTGRELPWGTLTGIRPVRLYDCSDRNIDEKLKKEYLISDEKLSLLRRTALREQEALSAFDYERGFSIYIGIPFCPSTCLYCSFTSNPILKYRDRIGEYLEALRKELRLTAEFQKGEGEDGRIRSHITGRELQTIYIGGGTPTALSASELDRLLSMMEEELDLSALRELTVEAGRPDSIDRDKLRVLKAHGVGRISINPQTMNDRTLRLIGRRHTAAQVEEAFHMAREEGFDNINMDLIMGLPEETERDVAYTLDRIREFRPESLTVHALAVKRAARLSTEGLAYAGLERAGAEEAARMMELGAACARELSMEPYYLYRQKNMAGNQENVGYCIPGREDLYNILMMEEKHTVVGVGAGSSTKVVIRNEDPSLYGGNRNRIERHENVKNIDIYLDTIDEVLKKRSL